MLKNPTADRHFGGTGLSCHSLIALFLIGLLISPIPLSAQQPPAQATAPAPAEPAGPPRGLSQGKIKILVLEGQNATNSLRSKTAISPVVQVLDSLEQPVEGATVTFEVAPTGPGGLFGTAPLATTRTDYTGQATAAFTPNNTPGTFSIKVKATIGDQSAEIGIRQTRVGHRIGDISAAIQAHVEGNGFSVVRDMVGHGVGTTMHEPPEIPNFGRKGTGDKIKAGMTLAIEPMVNLGGYKTKTLSDGWTIVTADGSPSAHFEHTVLTTEAGPEILTLPRPAAPAQDS